MAKRKNKTLVNIAKALMTEKIMSLYYWAEVVNTTNYILNKCITSGVHVVTPQERFYGRKPSLEHLKVFGCLAYVHVSVEVRSKRDPKAEKCVFRGILIGLML